MKIVIDDEFRDLIPKPTQEEHDALEASILDEGCREPLALWGNFIVDGHTRYEICIANSVKFQTRKMEFEDREEAMIWIIKNQFARRNISAMARAELALKLEPMIAAKAKNQQLRKPNSVSAISPEQKIDTREEVAKAAGMSSSTISKAKRIANSPVVELARTTREGKVSINAAAKVAKLPVEQQRKVVAGGPAAIKAKAKELTAAAPKWKFHDDVPKSVRDVFEQSGVIDEALAALTRVSTLVNQITGNNNDVKPMACGARMDRQAIVAAGKAIRSEIDLHRPATICPYCLAKTKSCSGCKGTGWTDKTHTCPKEKQAIVEKMVVKL